MELRSRIAPLFDGWQEAVIWSYLEGHMGEAFADDAETPKSACIVLGDFDYVVDAIDTVSAKLAIIEICKERNIPIISCMGAGNKLDATGFRVTDIYKTAGDPLCRVMRHELRKRGVNQLDVVFSAETPQKTGSKTVGSLPHVPAAAGLVAAGHVILKIARSSTAGLFGAKPIVCP